MMLEWAAAIALLGASPQAGPGDWAMAPLAGPTWEWPRVLFDLRSVRKTLQGYTIERLEITRQSHALATITADCARKANTLAEYRTYNAFGAKPYVLAWNREFVWRPGEPFAGTYEEKVGQFLCGGAKGQQLSSFQRFADAPAAASAINEEAAKLGIAAGTKAGALITAAAGGLEFAKGSTVYPVAGASSEPCAIRLEFSDGRKATLSFDALKPVFRGEYIDFMSRENERSRIGTLRAKTPGTPLDAIARELGATAATC